MTLNDLSSLLTSGAALAALGWLATKIYEFGVSWFEKRDRRQAAIIRFLTDLRIRVGDLRKVDEPAYISRLSDKIHDYEKQGKAFVFYGVQIIDTYAEDEISSYLHKFKPFTADLIRKFILYDSLVSKAYEKMQSQQFADLDSDRKIEALKAWIAATLLTVELGERLRLHLEQLFPKLAMPAATDTNVNGSTAEE